MPGVRQSDATAASGGVSWRREETTDRTGKYPHNLSARNRSWTAAQHSQFTQYWPLVIKSWWMICWGCWWLVHEITENFIMKHERVIRKGTVHFWQTAVYSFSSFSYAANDAEKTVFPNLARPRHPKASPGQMTRTRREKGNCVFWPRPPLNVRTQNIKLFQLYRMICRA